MLSDIFKSFFIVGFCILALSINVKAAEIKKEISKCSDLKDDLERLDCFDTLSRSLGLDQQKPTAPIVAWNGQWDVKIKTNPTDDSKTVILILFDESGKLRQRKPIALVIRCQSNETDLFITWNDNLGTETIDVLTQFGDQPTKIKKWSISDNGRATVFIGSPITFIKEIMQHGKLVAQVTPSNENRRTAIFDIRGLKNAIQPLQETCHWN